MLSSEPVDALPLLSVLLNSVGVRSAVSRLSGLRLPVVRLLPDPPSPSSAGRMSNVVVVKPARPDRSTYARALQYYSTNERARGNRRIPQHKFLA